MRTIEIIKCHGSGNDFVMVDATRENIADIDLSEFARRLCDRERGIGSDGILLLVRHDDLVYGMDMLNPDGTHAEMCGNGIRCVARLAFERDYPINGILRSGGRDYTVCRAEDIYKGIATFSVDIPIRTHSTDFAFFDAEERFVGKIIEPLHPDLRFTALNLGNPHIVAAVEHIDLRLLEALGNKVKDDAACRQLFPHGVNLSLYERRTERRIFVATFERGAGITLSCGTAMTASSTAAALLNIVKAGKRIEVCNRGGMVYCSTSLSDDITTRLEGNATFDWWGELDLDNDYNFRITRPTDEGTVWQSFVDSINNRK